MTEDASDAEPPREGTRGDSEHLRVLFLDVTGTEEIVETQARDRRQRELPPGWSDPDERVSEYVAEMAADDGLADAFGDPTDALVE